VEGVGTQKRTRWDRHDHGVEVELLAQLAKHLAVLRAELDALLAEGACSTFGELDSHVRAVETLFGRLRDLPRGLG
jgi:hypothetical protein